MLCENKEKLSGAPGEGNGDLMLSGVRGLVREDGLVLHVACGDGCTQCEGT